MELYFLEQTPSLLKTTQKVTKKLKITGTLVRKRAAQTSCCGASGAVSTQNCGERKPFLMLENQLLCQAGPRLGAWREEVLSWVGESVDMPDWN